MEPQTISQNLSDALRVICTNFDCSTVFVNYCFDINATEPYLKVIYVQPINNHNNGK